MNLQEDRYCFTCHVYLRNSDVITTIWPIILMHAKFTQSKNYNTF